LILPAVVGHGLRVSLLQDFGNRVQDFFPGAPANEQAMLGSNSWWPSRCKNGRSLPAGWDDHAKIVFDCRTGVDANKQRSKRSRLETHCGPSAR